MNNIKIERIGDYYLASNPQTGAISFFNPLELIAFQMFREAPIKKEAIQLFLNQITNNELSALVKAEEFLIKIEREGWLRCQIPEVESKQLQLVYFTVTLDCNLSCPYCYQGQQNQKNKRMSISDVKIFLNKIKELNPNSHVVITGGEPFTHKRIFDILEKVEENGFRFSILTNGTLINQSNAKKLTQYSQLSNVQVSIDGLKEKTHAITRGESFKETMASIQYLIDYKIPFSLAPTIHEGNIHEIYDLAHFAYSNNGTFSPNNLRVFPQCNQHNFKLTNEILYDVVKETERLLFQNFEFDKLKKYAKNVGHKKLENLADKRVKFICGMAGSVIDINWDGGVFPCNLLRENKFLLGNLLIENFQTIFQRVDEMSIRVFSYDIPKCKECKFVSTCGGGCRAGAYYNYGSFKREDNLCEILYESQIDSFLKFNS